jgi:GDP-L-fucose synthase
MSMDINARIYVAGHRGLVGSGLVRKLRELGYANLLLKTHAELDLSDQKAVQSFFNEYNPEYVFLAAAKVGGIHANATYPVQFIRDNLLIQTNIIEAAYQNGVKKLLFLGSSCIYPKFAPQPITESALLTGLLEPTNEYYAVAKIAGIMTCRAYRRQYGFDAISAMPTNLYGPGDNFHPENSHVVPALMRRFHAAKMRKDDAVIIWGTGAPLREFLHVDDLADALCHLMQNYSEDVHINVGCGEELTIAELANLIKDVVGFEGEVCFDANRLDGTPRKLLDVSRLFATGWHPRISLRAGLASTYAWYLDNSGTRSTG